MPPEISTQDDRLFELVQELSKDVKSLPSRHEFDALVGSQRRGFDSLESKFDKYVLASEFTTYKEYVSNQLVNLVSRLEYEARHKTNDVATAFAADRMTALEEFQKNTQDHRIQFPGAQFVIPGIVSALIALATHFIKWTQ